MKHLALILFLAASPVVAQHEHHQVTVQEEKPLRISIPDVQLVDQDGRAVRFPDLIKDRVVAVNFIFTTCTTVCPPMGATFGRLLKDRPDVHLISVSVDPRTDTPERLKAWAAKFGAGPGWTLVTGDAAQVRKLLDAFGVYTANPADHTPLVLVGNDARGEWTRAYGLAPPAKLAELIDKASRNPAQSYFGDIPLLNQDGETMRLYSDLIRGRTVVIDVMFTGCTGACPVMSRTFAKVQDWLGDRLGKDVYLISISVDPVNDTPEKLKAYAAGFNARPGWFFLTGKPEDVQAALGKLGQAVETREAHQNLFLIGNDRTGLWKKAMGLAAPEEILPIVDSVVNDRG
ncbi:MAG TPA: SCO family protein [Thermoanaerobaculia bacterium]|nr:SCO family protein [Thermoanaerobaculia bacterium]